jgi:hypothetical protein
MLLLPLRDDRRTGGDRHGGMRLGEGALTGRRDRRPTGRSFQAGSSATGGDERTGRSTALTTHRRGGANDASFNELIKG